MRVTHPARVFTYLRLPARLPIKQQANKCCAIGVTTPAAAGRSSCTPTQSLLIVQSHSPAQTGGSLCMSRLMQSVSWLQTAADGRCGQAPAWGTVCEEGGWC